MPFLSGYTKRKKITIDQTFVDADLTDFPLLVKFTDDADIGADIDASGLNVRFTSSDGTTLLKYERVSFDNGGSTATGVFWVKVPTIDDLVNTEIYIYYKAASPSDGQDVVNTWNTAFAAVYHFEQDPSGSPPQIFDSTANDRDGTSAGSMTSGDLVAVQVGNGLDFDGTDDQIDLPFSVSYPFTVSGIFAPAANTNCPAWGQRVSGDVFQYWDIKNGPNFADGYQGIQMTTRGGAGPSVITVTFSRVAYGTKCYFAIVCNSATDRTAYAQVVGQGWSTPVNDAVDLSPSGTTQRIGNSPNGFMNGTVDEIRISSSARAEAWLKFERANWFEADNEISLGTQELGGDVQLPRHLLTGGNLSRAGLMSGGAL